MGDFPITFTFTLNDQLSSAAGGVRSALTEIESTAMQAGGSLEMLTGTFQQAADGSYTLDQATGDMGQAFQNATVQADEINASYGRIGETAQTTKKSFQDSAMQANSLAMAGVTLALSFEQVEKAGLRVEKADLAVARSKENVDQATKKYNETVEKFGPTSEEAIDKADKLKIATEALSVATERQGIVHQDYTQALMFSSLSIIPSFISIVQAAGGATKIWTGIQAAFNAVMDANPVAIVILAIAGLVAVVIAAYELFPPFKDAVDAVGKAIGDGLGKAVEYIRGGLEWLWKNILEPFGNFIITTLMPVFKALGDVLNAIGNALKPIGDAWGWLAGIVGTAIHNLQADIELYNDLQAAMAESAKNGLSVMENYYMDKFDAMTEIVDENLVKQLELIDAKYADMTETQKTAYEADMKNFTDYWAQKYADQTTALDTADQQITTYYGKLITAVQQSTQEQIDVKQAGYDKELTDLEAFWNQKLGKNSTALTSIQGDISSYYSQEISDTQASYGILIDEANNYFNGLKAANDEGLAKIRASREDDLDALELGMLEQKVSMEQAHAAGILDDVSYNIQMAELSKSYNTQRGEMSDSYRLQELQAESENAAKSVEIEMNRTATVNTLKTEEAGQVQIIEDNKNAAMTEAAKQYSQITVTDFNALTDAITALKNAEASQVLSIENQKNAALNQAAFEYATINANNAAALVKINIDKANEIVAAEKAAAEQKRQDLADVEAIINANTKLSAAEKTKIIADMNAEILKDTQTQWNNIADTIQASMDKITAQNTAFKKALDSGKITADEYTEAMEVQNKNANSLATQANLNTQNAAFYQAYQQGKIDKEQYNAAITAQNKLMTEAGGKPTALLAKGAVIDRPTKAIIGEGGEKELVSPVSTLRGLLGEAFAEKTANFEPRKTGGTADVRQSGPITLTAAPVIQVTMNKDMSKQEIVSIMTQAVKSGTGQAFVVATAEASARLQVRRS